MLYKYLFNYTRKNYYNLIKAELKIMTIGAVISAALLALFYVTYKNGFNLSLLFIPFLLFSLVISLKYLVTYVYEIITMDIKFIECHYATINTKYHQKKDRHTYHVSYMDKMLEYQERDFRYTTTKQSQNNIIFNGPNIVLYHTKLTNILVGFLYSGKAVKFYNVDNGESQKIYESLIQK